MGKGLTYAGILGTIYVATDENLQKEVSEILSAFSDTTEGITSGMNEINKAISGLSDPYRISFKLGSNQFSLVDIYTAFMNKVASVWNSGEAFKVIASMIMLVLGAILLVLSPLISIGLYIRKGIKDKSNWINGLRAFLLQVGIEAGAGIVFVMLFIRIISL